jgi:hypothetical protein
MSMTIYKITLSYSLFIHGELKTLEIVLIIESHRTHHASKGYSKDLIDKIYGRFSRNERDRALSSLMSFIHHRNFVFDIFFRF